MTEAPFESPGTKCEAELQNATERPLAEIELWKEALNT